MNNFQTSKLTYDELSQLAMQLRVYLSLVLCILGIIGFVGNLFTYLQHELRSNTCCIYSLTGSVVDILNLMISLFPNYLSFKYNIMLPWYDSTLMCQLNAFLLVFLPQLSINCLLLAIIDRFAATCDLASPIRRILQLKFVPIMLALGIITSFLLSITGTLFFEKTMFWCASRIPLLTNLTYIILNGLFQPILMIIFVLLTYRNLRRSNQRVVSIVFQKIYFNKTNTICLIERSEWKKVTISNSICCNDIWTNLYYNIFFFTMDYILYVCYIYIE